MEKESVLTTDRHPWVYVGWALMLAYAVKIGSRDKLRTQRTVGDHTLRASGNQIHGRGRASILEKKARHDDPRDSLHSQTHKGKISTGWWQLLKKTFSKWTEDHAQTLGASLAFYTIFSLAPLLLIVIAIAGLVFGQEAAQGQDYRADSRPGWGKQREIDSKHD